MAVIISRVIVFFNDYIISFYCAHPCHMTGIVTHIRLTPTRNRADGRCLIYNNTGIGCSITGTCFNPLSRMSPSRQACILIRKRNMIPCVKTMCDKRGTLSVVKIPFINHRISFARLIILRVIITNVVVSQSYIVYSFR